MAFLLMGFGVISVYASYHKIKLANYRTQYTNAQVVNVTHFRSGIGSLVYEGYDVSYVFYLDGIKYEGKHTVDKQPLNSVSLRYDPNNPQNNALDMPNSSGQFLTVIFFACIIVGVVLAWHTWKPFKLFFI